ncbi:hypothetical protein JOD60_000760 [Microbacterium aurum]|nr:hypothetical protein [Microbacterium aurum]
MNAFEQTLLLVTSALMILTTLVVVIVQYVRGRGRRGGR